MNLAKSIPPIDLDPVHELKSSQLNNWLGQVQVGYV